LRNNEFSYNDAYCYFNKGELFLKNLFISEPKIGFKYDPIRERKLLLKRKELVKIQEKIKEKGLTLIPLNVYFNENNKVKITLGLGKGKKLYDKRETIKKRDNERELKKII
jgi:SsrA-binding protein